MCTFLPTAPSRVANIVVNMSIRNNARISWARSAKADAYKTTVQVRYFLSTFKPVSAAKTNVYNVLYYKIITTVSLTGGMKVWVCGWGWVITFTHVYVIQYIYIYIYIIYLPLSFRSAPGTNIFKGW